MAKPQAIIVIAFVIAFVIEKPESESDYESESGISGVMEKISVDGANFHHLRRMEYGQNPYFLRHQVIR